METQTTVVKVKELGKQRVTAEVGRLSTEWDRLVKEFLPIQEKLVTLQGSNADVERLIAERSPLLDELELTGDRLVALGATRVSGLGMALAPTEEG
jgi:hypothetical protein